MKGPILNDNHRGFTTRNSLGIEDVASSIAGELCPVVSTVTPRAFYWAFLVWIYYDYYKYSGIEDRTAKGFSDKYVKRQDYFFVLSQLLNNATDQDFLAGKENVSIDISPEVNAYQFNPRYYKARYGGMQYYNGGCLYLGFIKITEDGKQLSFPKVTKSGERLALAFEEVIKHTLYYRYHRLSDDPVPREVLIEYGKVINIGMNGFEKCKFELRNKIQTYPMLRDSVNYVRYIYSSCDMSNVSLREFRHILFDVFSPRGENLAVPDELRIMSNGWEMVAGRMYFTCAIECIWKYMLMRLGEQDRLSKEDWIKESIAGSEWSFDLNCKLSEIVDDCNYDFQEREDMIYKAARRQSIEKMVENGLRLTLSIYNRFKERTDFGEESAFLTKGNDTSSISFEELLRRVEEYKNRSVKEFLEFVMDIWLIEQHYNTAYEKLMRSDPLDGFFYEFVNGYYIHKHDFGIDFQEIRLNQLSHVMKDLDMLQ